MTPQAHPSGPLSARFIVLGEWILVVGLAATLAWTTLCLGGFLARTMIVSAWAVFGLAALGGLLWALGREPRVFNRAALLPVPFLLYALASVLWLTPVRWLGWREWLLWVQMWLVFVLALHFGLSRRQTWVFIATFVLLGLVGAGMAAYQRFNDPAWLMLGRRQARYLIGRPSGMFGIPNSLTGLLELMIPACLTLMFSRTTRPAGKILCGWLAILFVLAVVLTGSRGGWLGLGLVLIVWPLLVGRDWRRQLAGGILVLGLLVGGGTVLYQNSSYVHQRLQPVLEGKFEASRPLLWKAGLQIWQADPWLGSGAASYNVVFERYRPPGFWDTPVWTHNDYLNTLSDYGLVGFGLWTGAGAMLLWLGWRAVRRARREAGTTVDILGRPAWRMGLLLGLLAFGLHLVVDFHTKIPALAYAAALVMALLLREEPGLDRPAGRVGPPLAGLALAGLALGLAVFVASPLYRAEALRFDARRLIDRKANYDEGDMRDIIPAAKAGLVRAVRIDPNNAQAWADLSYATSLGWGMDEGDKVALGRYAELAADEALKRCPAMAEFWVRKGVALDIQMGRGETEACFRQALDLAPNLAVWWYYYAYHLSLYPARKTEAIHAVETCLTLDPYYSAAESLRHRLRASQ